MKLVDGEEYIRAIGVGETSFKIGDTVYPVKVSEAKINLIVIDGQSNAAGNAGESFGVDPISTDYGNGFIWNGSEFTDLKVYIDKKVSERPAKSVGFYPAIAAEWFELTGEKTAIVHLGHNGQPISSWESKGYTTQAIKEINNSIEVLKNNENYIISNASYYWLQGESNASIEESHNNDQNIVYTTTPEYEVAYKEIHDAYIQVLKKSGVEAIGGILTVRSRSNLLGRNQVSEYLGVRAAQQNLSNQNNNLIMASVLTDTWALNGNESYSYISKGSFEVKIDHLKDLFSVSGGPIHYTQTGYNILGLDAADSMYEAMVNKTKAKDFTLYGHDAVTVYSDGDVVELVDNMREWNEVVNPGEATAAQIVVRPEPSGGIVDGVTITLTNASGDKVDGVIGDNGYIADTTKVTEELILTIRMGDVQKTYILKP